jgi:hypothetical protein
MKATITYPIRSLVPLFDLAVDQEARPTLFDKQRQPWVALLIIFQDHIIIGITVECLN